MLLVSELNIKSKYTCCLEFVKLYDGNFEEHKDELITVFASSLLLIFMWLIASVMKMEEIKE